MITTIYLILLFFLVLLTIAFLNDLSIQKALYFFLNPINECKIRYHVKLYELYYEKLKRIERYYKNSKKRAMNRMLTVEHLPFRIWVIYYDVSLVAEDVFGFFRDIIDNCRIYVLSLHYAVTGK